ncbi:hypothetical protein ACFX2J_005876 [Malus domestica]
MPGTDLLSESLLCQTLWQVPRCDLISGEDNRVTVTDVLQYSLTWVIIPSLTVHACTHETERTSSYPSASTIDPNATIERGTNLNDESYGGAPVSRRFKCW